MGSIRELTKKDGNTTYHAEVRMKGQKPLRGTFRTRTLAKKWIQDTESGIRDGRYFRTTESRKHTVAEMIERFIAQWLPKYPQRQKKQKALLLWWKQQCGHLLLIDLTPSVIAELRDKLLSEVTVRNELRSPSTVNRYLSALGKVLTVCMKEWGWIEEHPMRKVTKLREAPGRERFLSLEEKDRFLAACRQSRNRNLYPIISLALITGMRFGEITGLRWGDVNFIQNTLTIENTKNGDRRIIPLTQAMKHIFQLCSTYGLPADEFVFQTPRKQRITSVRGAFNKALERASIEDFTFHSLRHTAASFFAMNGSGLTEMAAILGHKTLQMVKRYSHFSQAHLYAVIERNEKTLIAEEASD